MVYVHAGETACVPALAWTASSARKDTPSHIGPSLLSAAQKPISIIVIQTTRSSQKPLGEPLLEEAHRLRRAHSGNAAITGRLDEIVCTLTEAGATQPANKGCCAVQ